MKMRQPNIHKSFRSKLIPWSTKIHALPVLFSYSWKVNIHLESTMARREIYYWSHQYCTPKQVQLLLLLTEHLYFLNFSAFWLCFAPPSSWAKLRYSCNYAQMQAAAKLLHGKCGSGHMNYEWLLQCSCWLGTMWLLKDPVRKEGGMYICMTH